ADGAVRELVGELDMRDPKFTADGSAIVYSVATPRKTSYDNKTGTDYGVFHLQLADGRVDTLVKPADHRITPQWNESGSAFAYADKGNVFVRWVNADSARNLTERYRNAEPGADTSRTDTTRTDSTKTSFAL